MKTYRIPQTDLDVSRIAFGCDRLVRDGASPESLTAGDIADAARVVNVAHEHGITLFDTASGYGAGSSEAALGQVFALSPGLRQKVVVQTKCSSEHSRASIIRNVEVSLRRLGTDYLDLLLLHTQDPLMQPEEVADAFDDLNRSGKVRYFGVSNHTITRIELLKRYLRQPLVVNQVQLGLAHSDLLNEVYFDTEDGTFHLAGPHSGIAGLDYSRLNDMQVQAYSPLRGKNVFGTADLLGSPTVAPSGLKKAAQSLHELAAAKGTTPAAVGLAWLLGHPGHIMPIIGSKRAEHIVDSCAADDVNLAPEEWRALWMSALGLTAA